MRILKHKGIGKYIGISTVVILAAAAAVSLFLWFGQQQMEAQIRASVSNLLGTVVKQYPQVEEAELIDILNGADDREDGEGILTKYGITEEISVLADFEAVKHRALLLSFFLVIAMGILLLALFFCFLKEREKRVHELTDYMKRISDRDYQLALAENSEDELSHLQNELYKVTVMLREASEHNKAQREALQQSLSDISHQLKTPMTSIQILLDNLLEDPKMDVSVRVRFLEEISRQTEGMIWLIQMLLKLSRLDADVVNFASEKIMVSEMVQEICQKLAVLAEVKEVELQVEGNMQANIRGDYAWNCEALLNIVKNAIEHSRPGTAVRISIEENEVYTKISVADCGEGISREDQRHIFDRFYRAKNAAKDSVGIGLAMAKAVVEKQGGYIMVDSVEGEGTTFAVKYMKLLTGNSN